MISLSGIAGGNAAFLDPWWSSACNVLAVPAVAVRSLLLGGHGVDAGTSRALFVFGIDGAISEIPSGLGRVDLLDWATSLAQAIPTPAKVISTGSKSCRLTVVAVSPLVVGERVRLDFGVTVPCRSSLVFSLSVSLSSHRRVS